MEVVDVVVRCVIAEHAGWFLFRCDFLVVYYIFQVYISRLMASHISIR